MVNVFLSWESRQELREYKEEHNPELKLALFEPEDDDDLSEDHDEDDLDEEECSDAESSGLDFFEDYIPKAFPPINLRE